ncbi:MAG TPA: helix-turn-helix transcriptional regulator [Flavitalea sp.]|nr:helix-turn-helix transcriptional regulator [Flavitalea sp.]
MLSIKKYIQHHFLKIAHFVTDHWDHPVHNHNHFEVIFVHRGKGTHRVSGMEYSFEGRTFFILAPCDYHEFVLEGQTEFTFIKFTNVYLNGVGSIPASDRWNQDIDQLMNHARTRQNMVLPAEEDVTKAEHLVILIVKEWTDTKEELGEVLFFLIQSLFSLLKRNVAVRVKEIPPNHLAKLTSILHYIHEHIYASTELQAEVLAAKFSLSKNYLGIYFKDHMGVSLRDYINGYRLQLIESRLQFSSMSIKEISAELGFTDLSHFNKFYRKLKGTSPSTFRKKEQVSN